MKEQYWKYSLILLKVGLGLLLFKQAQPFMNGILGGFTLFLLVRNWTYRLKARMKPSLAVWLVTIGTTLFFLIPLSFLVWMLIDQLSGLHLDAKSLVAPARQAAQILKEHTGFDVFSENSISFMVSHLSSFGQQVMSGVSDFFINLCVAIMLLFFLLYEGKSLEEYILTILPFKERDKKEVLDKIQVIVRSNAIGIPLLAVIQGIISLGGYWLCGAPNPVFSAMLTAFASIIPLVGTALVWVPISIYFLLTGNWVSALILLGYGGIVISQCDNLIRFMLQKKMANIHPLITIFGVVAGLPIFGFMGIIFGPLLVSLFLLFLDMFRKEYLLSEPVESPSSSNSEKN